MPHRQAFRTCGQGEAENPHPSTTNPILGVLGRCSRRFESGRGVLLCLVHINTNRLSSVTGVGVQRSHPPLSVLLCRGFRPCFRRKWKRRLASDRRAARSLENDRSILGSPAHAGIDRCGQSAPSTLSRFPRTRGDRPAILEERSGVWAVPPHTRG